MGANNGKPIRFGYKVWSMNTKEIARYIAFKFSTIKWIFRTRHNKRQQDSKRGSSQRHKKAPRGTFDHCVAKDVGIILARWVGNSIDTAAPTLYGVQPTSNVKRYSQSDTGTETSSYRSI
ncbi:hypothetical protein JTB14_005361 [Gonioctena quinquepunctata]|nr:hypothetical protein JTB14_005361 [Gonioctena quinquepunctata]